MNVSGWLMNIAMRALAESMDVHTMTHLAKRIFPQYDLYEQTGISRNLAVPNKTAAKQIISDIRAQDLFLDFVMLLVEIHETGFKGRKYKIPYLRDIMGEISKEGLLYDEESKTFYEDPRQRRTRNWGVLREREEYIFTFMLIDIVGNTALVRQYPEEVVEQLYEDLRKMVQHIIERRNGRVWNWEGDGGLAAFYFANKNNHAALSSMEILHELYLYNLMRGRIDGPLSVRIAMHSGPCEFRQRFHNISSETMRTLEEIEGKYTSPDSATFSSTVYRMLNHTIADQLTPIEDAGGNEYYSYTLKWES